MAHRTFPVAQKAPIVPFEGFFESFNGLTTQAAVDLKLFLRKLQDNPYDFEVVTSYQTDFENDMFTRYSSLGYSIEWHIEATPFDDSSTASSLRILLTQLSVTGRRR